MNELNKLEENLEKKFVALYEELKKRKLSIQMLDAFMLKDLDISFKDENGVKQSGKISKFASLYPEKQRARIQVWSKTNAKAIYKELSLKSFLKNVILTDDEITLEIAADTVEELKKCEKLFKDYFETYKKNCEIVKKDFRNMLKKDFKKASEDTFKALERMSEELNKKYIDLGKKLMLNNK